MGFEYLFKQEFQSGKNNRERVENHHNEADRVAERHANALRIFLCDHFGSDFSKNQNNDGRHRNWYDAAHRRIGYYAFKDIVEKHRQRYVDEVVSHKYGW